MIKLLLLTCGTNACFHIAKVLKQKFSNTFYIIGCDTNKRWLISSCNYLDDFYQVPPSINKDYYPFILNICKTKQIDWILPLLDNDLFLFSCDNEDLKKLKIKSFGINSSLIFYNNKMQTNKYLESIGIPVPKYFSKDTIDNDTEYFIKPIHGFGSIGIKKEKGSVLKNIDNENYIIQELCSEPEYTLECFFYNKKIYSITRERIASKSGVCTKTKIFKNKDLEQIAYKFASNTELPYIFNMQFMKNRNGEYVCTDLNLRAAGGMGLSYTAGWDIVSSMANIMLEKDEKIITASVDKNISEQYIIRHYEDSVTKIVRKRIAFDLDGTILDSRKRHEIVMTEVLNNHKICLNTSDLVSFKTNGKNNLAWLLDKGLSTEIANKINSAWISLIEDKKYLEEDVLYPNTIKSIEILSRENDLFLITARKNKQSALNQITTLGISQYFSKISVVDACSITPKLKAEKLTEYKVDYFIGDTESDLEAALLAGCNFKATSYGFRNKDYWINKQVESYNNIESVVSSIL